MDADQIIQTARANLDKLLERAADQSAELTDAAGEAEYTEVYQALADGTLTLAALRERLGKLDNYSKQQERPHD